MAEQDPEWRAAVDYLRAGRQAEENLTRAARENLVKAAKVLVTTGDLHTPYTIIGPVFFHVANWVRGPGSNLDKLKTQYIRELAEMRKQGQIGDFRLDLGSLLIDWSVGHQDFDAAFYIAVQELRKRAAMLGADAIIAMRQDIDIDRGELAYFYLQMYGTAVKVS